MGMPEKIEAAIREFRDEVRRNYDALLKRIVDLEEHVKTLEDSAARPIGRRDSTATRKDQQ